MPVFLTGVDSAVISTFSNSVNSANSQVMQLVGIALGAALGIVIAIFAIKKAIGFFKQMANK